MAKTLEIIASGTSPRQSLSIQGGNYAEGGLTASGTTKATSPVLPAAKNYISICSSGKGFSFAPGSQQGDKIEVYNGGNNACLIYTTIGSSDTITNGSANAGFSVGSFKSATFDKVTNTLWMPNLSA